MIALLEIERNESAWLNFFNEIRQRTNGYVGPELRDAYLREYRAELIKNTLVFHNEEYYAMWLMRYS